MIARKGMSVFVLAPLISAGIAGGEIVRQPLNTGVALEYGQIYHSANVQVGDYNRKFTLKRPTGWIVQTTTIDERFEVTAGIGATFFVLYPDEGQAFQHAQIPGVALAQASGSYVMGDVKDPALKVSFGFMPYKYNAQAQNLGEYLFRATPYPNTIINSSFNLVNSAQAKMTGAVFSKNLLEGRWKNDVVLSSSDAYPLHDVSAAYVTSLKFHPLFELGAGVNFFHLVPVNSKLLEKKSNAYFTYQNEEYSAFGVYYITIANYYNISGDSVKAAEYAAKALLVDSLVPFDDEATDLVSRSYYSVGGTMLMGRFCSDFGSLLGDKVDLKLYGELALLGVSNYPVFYENRGDRMPMMLGVNLPTWGLLDVLGVEMERWKNPHLNSAYSLASAGGGYGALPDFQNQADRLHADPTRRYSKDDIAWSVTVAKSLGKAFTISAKAAKDHLTQFNFGDSFPRELQADIFPDNKGWYYVLRMQMAM